MAESGDFQSFLQRVRAGDAEAARELVQRYEAAIRRTIRMRMRDPRLRRAFDSMDVCQSVLASFFTRAALGQYDLDQPEDLLRLLARMAQHKVINQVNHQRAARRDIGRVEAQDPVDRELVGTEQTPSAVVAGAELLQEVRRRLSADERLLAERRAEGRDWAAIAAEVGGTPDGARKKLTRALDRVAKELHLEE